MPAVAFVDAVLRMDARQVTKTLDKVKSDVTKFAGNSRAIAAAAGAGLLSASVGLAALAVNLKGAADEADAIGDSLAQAFKGEQLNAVTKKVLELGAQGVFTEKAFEGVAKAVNKFGKDAEPALQRLADVASKTGAPLDALGAAYARLGKDDKATKQILKLTGIQPAELVKFGAVLDSTGKSLDISGENADKLVEAFNRLADSDRFAGAMLAGTDGASQLSAELKLLKQEVGAGLVTAWENAGSAILPVAKFFRSFSDDTKKLVGIGVLAASAATGLGAIGIAGALAANAMAGAVIAAGGLAAFFAPLAALMEGPLLVGLIGAKVAFLALNAVLTPLTLTFGALAVGVYKYTTAIQDATKAAEDLLAIEEKRAGAARHADQFIGKSAQELLAAGKTAKEVAAVADGLTDRAQAAFEAGNTALTEKIKAQVAELRRVQHELSALEADKREEKAIQNDVQAALGPGPNAEEIAAREKSDDEARKKREEADQKADAERTRKAKAEHEKRLKDRQAALDKGAKLEIQSNYPVAKAAEDLTKTLKDEHSKRLKNQADAVTAALAQAKQNADDLAGAQSENRNLKQGALTDKVGDLQANTEETGTDNTAKITSAFTERLRLQVESIRLEAERDKAATKSADARTTIEENAQLRIQAAQRSTNEEYKRAIKEQQDLLDKARQDEAQKSTLGTVMSLQDALSSSSLNFGVGRSRQGNAVADLPSLQSAIQPVANAASDSGGIINFMRQAMDNFATAAKAQQQEVKVDIAVKDDRTETKVKRDSPSGDGVQSSLATTGRSIRRR